MSVAAAGAGGVVELHKSEFASWFDDVPRCTTRHAETKDRVFLVPLCSETNIDGTLKVLAIAPVVGNVMIATAGFYALHAAAIRGDAAKVKGREVTHIIFTDRSDIQEVFWRKMQEILLTTDDRQAVIARIHACIEENKDQFFPKCPSVTSDVFAQGYLHGMNEEIRINLSWLADDERFHRVQTIFREGRFVYLKVDLTSADSMKAIADTLSHHGLSIDSVFLSNTRESNYVSKKVLPLYRKAVSHLLPTPDTLIVDTKDRCCQESGILVSQVRRKGDKAMEEVFPASPPCHGHAVGLSSRFVIPTPPHFTWK